MKELFLWLLNNSISAAWLMPVILLVRLFLSRKSRTVSCFLWVLLAVRLITPVSIESPLCVLPTSAPIVQESFSPAPETPVRFSPEKVETANAPDLTLLQNLRLEPQTSSEVAFDMLGALSFVWLVGFAGMSVYAVGWSIATKRRLSASLAVGSRLYSCDYIEEPLFSVCSSPIYIFHPV